LREAAGWGAGGDFWNAELFSANDEINAYHHLTWM
jgi:hypothetical protein